MCFPLSPDYQQVLHFKLYPPKQDTSMHAARNFTRKYGNALRALVEGNAPWNLAVGQWDGQEMLELNILDFAPTP